MRRGRTLILLLALAAAGCASSGSGPEATLCDFGAARPETQRLGHVLRSGSRGAGEIDIETYREWMDGVPSAMARPVQDVYRRSVRKDCHNEAEDYWYPCLEDVEIDLSEIRGVARAIDLDRAEREAILLCQQMTRRAVPRLSPLQQEEAQLYCKLSHRVICPLPNK